MKADLADLHIHLLELERLVGLEINDVFIGGLWNGTVRSSAFRHPQRFLSFVLTEVTLILLAMIVAIPIGLVTIRRITNAIQDPATIAYFLGVTLGVACLLTLLWNGIWWFKAQQLYVLAALLDDVDRYNEVIHAVDLLDRLEAAGNSHISLDNRVEILQALGLVRESLVCGVMTDRILRENRGLLSRRHDLVANIESNLSTLRTIEVTHQASEYGELLQQALQIGTSVHQEIQSISGFLSE